MTKQKYRVVRPHDGDRWYDEGDTRTAKAADVKHLVPHVLEPIGDADDDDEPAGEEAGEKAETEHPNKAEAAAPANKAETRPATRRGARGA